MTNVAGRISESCALVIGAWALVIPFPCVACDNLGSLGDAWCLLVEIVVADVANCLRFL